MFASAAGSGAALQGDDPLRNHVPVYPGLELAADPVRTIGGKATNAVASALQWHNGNG